jgi:hypothetical protein
MIDEMNVELDVQVGGSQQGICPWLSSTHDLDQSACEHRAEH